MAEPPRHVLITGGTRGLGHALARRCLARGDFVSTCSRSPQPSLHAENHRHYVANVAEAAEVEGLLECIRVDRGYLDALVNNAGVASMNLVALTPNASIQHVLRTNVEGTIVASRAAVRLLRRSPAGRIVNVTSVAVPLRLTGEAVYAASKSAVETFTRIAARELGQFGITCNAVGPSPIRTALTAGVAASKLESLVSHQAIPRWATTDDFIHVVEFFLDPGSAMVTGQVVYLGGAG